MKPIINLNILDKYNQNIYNNLEQNLLFVLYFKIHSISDNIKEITSYF